MMKIRPNRTYACIQTIVVPTVLFGEKKTSTLKVGCYYHVNYDGQLETHDGLAEITDEIAECLVVYRSDEEIKRCTDMRNLAAAMIVSGIVANDNEVQRIRQNKDTYFRVQYEISERAIKQANTLVRKLIDSEDEWIQELKYI